jgi:asparagine synthase (glutamine-hydrolysing)
LDALADQMAFRAPYGVVRHSVERGSLCESLFDLPYRKAYADSPAPGVRGRFTVVSDARIDGRAELFSKLGLARDAELISDSELILKAYERWGIACLDHLCGDFAFAIWDKFEGNLFVARDVMGCRPLYFHHNGLRFAFASSAIALSRVSWVQTGVNYGRVADYLVQDLEGFDSAVSFFEGIFRLPPAHFGVFRNGSFETKRYWSLEGLVPLTLSSSDAYLEGFEEVYTASVEDRLEGDSKPISMLSGGLDSSTIVALARGSLARSGRSNLTTVSAISRPGLDCNETACIRRIVQAGGLNAKMASPGQVEDYFDGIYRGFAHMEDPFDISMIMPALLYLVSRECGGRFVLDGIDGEHVAGLSTGYLSTLCRAGLFRTAWREARGFSRHYYRGEKSPLRLYAAAIKSCLAPSILRARRLDKYCHTRVEFRIGQGAISRELAEEIDLRRRYSQCLSREQGDLAAGFPGMARHLLEVPYLTAGIERYERVASYFGVQGRHPLLDKRVIEYCARLPWHQKVNGGWTKYILRRMAEKHLPDEIAWREGWEQLGWKFANGYADAYIRALPSSATLSPTLQRATGRSSLESAVELLRLKRESKMRILRQLTLDNWLTKIG